MKHLKKILVALMVLCLLVSAAVMVISAEGGTVSGLRTLYERVENYSDGVGKSEQLARAYAYLAENPIDPTEEGYAELLAEMQTKSVEVAGMLYTAIPTDQAGNKTGSPLDWLTSLNAVYAHFEACPPADDTAGYAEMLAQLDQDNVSSIEELHRLSLDEATTALMARHYLVSAFEQMEYKPLPEANADVVTNCKNAAFAKAQALYAEYEAAIPAPDAEDTDENYMKRINTAGTLVYFLGEVDLTGVEGASELTAKANAAKRDSDADRVERMEKLDSVADFASYAWTENSKFINFDDGSKFTSHNHNATHYNEVRTDSTGNKYFTLVFGTEATHLYTEPTATTDEMGLVRSMDLMFSNDFYSLPFQTHQSGNADIPTIFQFTGDRKGSIKLEVKRGTTYKGDTAALTDLVVPNVWFNLIMTFNPETLTGEVYINYVKVLDVTYKDTHKFLGLRMGANTTNQEVSFDNYQEYQGTQFRIFDKFEKMNDEEKFKFYVDYFTDDSYNPTNRNAAYLKARELISIIPDTDEIQEYKERYAACDYEEDIRKPAMALNLESIKEMVAELPAIEDITSETRVEVANKLDEIDKFIADNNELINRADNSEGGYLEQVAKLNAARDAISRIVAAEDFVTALSKFKRATSYASMSKHAATADAIYKEAGYSKQENIDFVKNDPVILAFELTLNGEEILPEDEDNYVTAFEYYLTFVDSIAERVKFENSKRIIDCVNFITSLEGYEATEEFWSENIDYISKYVTIIRNLVYSRDVVVANNFDLEYEGVVEALETFYAIDAYCYEVLQQEHIALLEEQLDAFLTTDAYIERVGICTYLAGYIAESELVVYIEYNEQSEEYEFIYNTALVDIVAAEVEDEADEIRTLIYRYLMYNSELEAQQEDYAAVLEANTAYFIDTVKVLTSVTSYAEKREIADLATTYYYGMNVDSEDAAEAIAVYNEIVAELNDDEFVATSFLLATMVLEVLNSYEDYEEEIPEEEKLTEAERKDSRYMILALGSYIREAVNVQIPGVEEAVEIFDAEFTEYAQQVEMINSDIEDATGVALAARTNVLGSTSLAGVAAIIGTSAN